MICSFMEFVFKSMPSAKLGNTSEQTIAIVFRADLKDGRLVILGVYACFCWFG